MWLWGILYGMTHIAENYFELFGLTHNFNIDKDKLDKSYRNLQQITHPDRFINQATEFQRKAVQQTAFNSEAYQVLKSPVFRACHLLTVLGHDFNLNSFTVTDMELLMQQLEYREQLSVIKDKADMDELVLFSGTLDKLIDVTMVEINRLFESDLKAHLPELKNNICELQFLNKLTVDLEEVEEQLILIA
jgi:molecular chaperone HscB